MTRLRNVSASQPGWRRIHHGRGHRYLNENGAPLDAVDVARVKALAIPPAWRDVWVCPHPNGHLQAVGTDAAGRRQYLYHPVWRDKRDAAKFERVIDLGAALPNARHRLRADLDLEPHTPSAVLAAAVRMVDLGCFRLGSDTYAADNGSYGLTTLQRRHLKLTQRGCELRFVGKSGVDHHIVVADQQVCRVLHRIAKRAPREEKVLRAKIGRFWRPVEPSDINTYIKDSFQLESTAKDFRTWHATVHVAHKLSDATWVKSQRQRDQLARAAVVSASQLLGNTPTVCRASYVNPAVIEAFEDGVTVRDFGWNPDGHPDADAARDALDESVVRLLRA